MQVNRILATARVNFIHLGLMLLTLQEYLTYATIHDQIGVVEYAVLSMGILACGP